MLEKQMFCHKLAELIFQTGLIRVNIKLKS